MLVNRLPLLGVLLVSGAAVSQAPSTPASIVGSAAKVQGLVTVSDGKTIASVINGNHLVEGSRIVTSSSGSVTVKTNSGCEIKLGPNESLTLHGERSCDALVLSIQSLPIEFNVAAARGTLLMAIPALTGALLGPSSRTVAIANPGLPGDGDGGGGGIPNIPISDR